MLRRGRQRPGGAELTPEIICVVVLVHVALVERTRHRARARHQSCRLTLGAAHGAGTTRSCDADAPLPAQRPHARAAGPSRRWPCRRVGVCCVCCFQVIHTSEMNSKIKEENQTCNRRAWRKIKSPKPAPLLHQRINGTSTDPSTDTRRAGSTELMDPRSSITRRVHVFR